MRWEDERYVRLYTRDTPEWTLVPFESRCLYYALLRAVDRAGIMPLGKTGTKGVASMVRAPDAFVKRHLQALLDDGCVVISDDHAGGQTLVLPNFMAAQEARQSDRARQQQSRERARDQATGLTENHNDVAGGLSHGVTRGHTASHDVTPSCADPSCADPSCADRVTAAAADAASPADEKPKGKKPKAAPKTAIPEGWLPDPEVYEWARTAPKVRLDRDAVDGEAEKFADGARANARRYADWDGAFRNWLRNARAWRPDLPEPAAPPRPLVPLTPPPMRASVQAHLGKHPSVNTIPDLLDLAFGGKVMAGAAARGA